MVLSLMRRIRFCAGHRLWRHEGKCAFLHGHNYIADVHVTGEQTDDVGRLVDFSVLKTGFKGWIDAHWDHAFLLHAEDAEAIAAISQMSPSRYFLLPYNPTAENLARYLLEEVGPHVLLDSPVRLTRVAIWETGESCAEARLGAQGELHLTSRGWLEAAHGE